MARHRPANPLHRPARQREEQQPAGDRAKEKPSLHVRKGRWRAPGRHRLRGRPPLILESDPAVLQPDESLAARPSQSASVPPPSNRPTISPSASNRITRVGDGLALAGASPGRPDVDDERLAAEVGERDRPSVEGPAGEARSGCDRRGGRVALVARAAAGERELRERDGGDPEHGSRLLEGLRPSGRVSAIVRGLWGRR